MGGRARVRPPEQPKEEDELVRCPATAGVTNQLTTKAGVEESEDFQKDAPPPAKEIGNTYVVVSASRPTGRAVAEQRLTTFHGTSYSGTENRRVMIVSDYVNDVVPPVLALGIQPEDVYMYSKVLPSDAPVATDLEKSEPA